MGKVKIPKKGTMIKVIWHDSHSYHKWEPPEQAEQGCVPVVCETVGFVVANKNCHVSVSGSITLNQEKSITHVNGTMTIPEACIKKIIRLKG